MKRFCFVLTIVLLTSSCFDKRSDSKNETETKTIYQVSYHHGGLGKDSVVLLSNDDKSDFYNEVQIFRGHQKIFDHVYENLEIVGTPLNIFTEQDLKKGNEYFYILKLFNAPSPSKFFIVKTSKEQTTLFGITGSNTADIFGDIDFDGKFEIGGWTDYCQEYEQHKCPDENLYTVFEVDADFPTDTSLTNYFKGQIKNK
jgi:hypothetical protein